MIPFLLLCAQSLTATPPALTLRPNQFAAIRVTPPPARVDASSPLARLDLDPRTGVLLVQAPAQPGEIVLRASTADDGVEVPIHVIAHPTGRAIVGVHQTGASSARATQHYFFDFYVTRPLGDGWSLWGDVRVSSAPQQIDIPIARFAPDFARQLGAVEVNRLALAGEFLTGFEIRLRRFEDRQLGLAAFYGSTGALSDPASQARVFRRSDGTYVGYIPQDRDRFHRQYGAGLRYTRQSEMFTVTIGQDQSVTGGRYRGPVLRVDAFYPVPLGRQSVYFFATANLAVARQSPNAPPQALELAPDVPIHDPRVILHVIPSARDSYKIGFGVDLIALLSR